MKLKHFRIKNIKSIIDSGVCHLSGDNITVLAGQNESGKSAILEALNYFTKGSDEKFEQYLRRTDQSLPLVECCFELEESDKEYEDEDYTKIIKQLSHINLYREDSNDIEFTDETKKTISDIVNALAENNELNCLSTNTENESIDALDNKIEELKDGISSAIIKYIPKFDYYDSFNNILPETISIEDIKTNKAVLDFEAAFEINLEEYINMPDREQVQKRQSVETNFKVDFNDYWTQSLIGEDSNKYSFILKDRGKQISFLVDRENNTPLYIIQKSKGFQWFNAFYLRLKALQKNEENLERYILLIDEPGQGLHEKAQENVKQVLEDLALKGMQIIYSTHHSKLIDVDDKLTRLRLIYQDKTEGTKINTLSQMASKKGEQSLDTLSPLRTAMGLVNLSCLDLSNNKNVILEGITDKYYIEAFVKLLNIDFSYNLIPSCGCENIKNIASILLGWGYQFKTIIDKGEGQNPQEAKTQKIIEEKLLAGEDESTINRIVKRLEQTAIEDVFTKQDFRSYVKPEDVAHSNKGNLTLAKEFGKKELWARLFLEKVNTGELTADNFQENTLREFREIINWIEN